MTSGDLGLYNPQKSFSSQLQRIKIRYTKYVEDLDTNNLPKMKKRLKPFHEKHQYIPFR